jgi:hypothetical protein
LEEFRKCIECAEIKPLELFKHSKGSYRQKCRACNARWERIKLRLDIIGHYGAKCACCGITIIEFLTFDHVENDGNIERRELAQHQIYAKAKREGYPDTYQLLCGNCHIAKTVYGMCPHKR